MPRGYGLPALLSLLIAASLWPAASRIEFSNGSEQLVVAAALESRRSGSPQRLVVPTMNGEPRLRKPPLTTWLAMAVVPQAEARALAQGPVDEAAFASIAWRIRSVALLLAAITLLGTFELGRVLTNDRRLGLAAMLVAGSTFLIVDQFTKLTTDATLAATVVWANVALAHAWLRNRAIAGGVTTGVLLGLSFLAKGPVGLLQVVAPALAMLALLRLTRRRVLLMRAPPTLNAGPEGPGRASETHSGSVSDRTFRSGVQNNSSTTTSRRRLLIAVAMGVVAFALVALPWFAHVLATEPGAWSVWTTEVARTDETVPPSDVLAYGIFPLLLGPWTIFAVVGLITGLAEIARRLGGGRVRWLRRGRSFGRFRGRGLAWAALMVIVPIVMMTLFRDRKDRYLLPLVPPACVLTVAALRLVEGDLRRRPVAARLALGGQGLVLLVLAVGVPVATAVLPRDAYAEREAWVALPTGVGLAIVGALLWLGGGFYVRGALLPRTGGLQSAGLVAEKMRLDFRIAIVTLVLFVFVANVFLVGYANSREARSDQLPLATVIRQQTPGAELWHGEPFVRPDLLIYVGREVRPLPKDGGDLDASRQHVYLVRQRREGVDPEPTMPPPWRVLATARRDRSIWWAFVRNAEH